MKTLSILLVVSIAIVAGCGRKEKKERAAEAERLSQADGKTEVLVDSDKLLDADKLKGLLPKTLPNMKRVGSPTAKMQGPIGKRITRAEVSFEGAEGELVEISITDAVSAKGLAAIPDSDWTTKNVGEDTDTRFVGVETKDGHRMYKENNTTGPRKVRVLVGNRFVVEVVGLNIDYQAVEDMLKTISIGTLEKTAAGK